MTLIVDATTPTNIYSNQFTPSILSSRVMLKLCDVPNKKEARGAQNSAKLRSIVFITFHSGDFFMVQLVQVIVGSLLDRITVFFSRHCGITGSQLSEPCHMLFAW